MAFRWRAEDGPTLDGGLAALIFFRGSGPILLKNPTFLQFFKGGGGANPLCPLWIRPCNLTKLETIQGPFHVSSPAWYVFAVKVSKFDLYPTNAKYVKISFIKYKVIIRNLRDNYSIVCPYLVKCVIFDSNRFQTNGISLLQHT